MTQQCTYKHKLYGLTKICIHVIFWTDTSTATPFKRWRIKLSRYYVWYCKSVLKKHRFRLKIHIFLVSLSYCYPAKQTKTVIVRIHESAKMILCTLKSVIFECYWFVYIWSLSSHSALWLNAVGFSFARQHPSFRSIEFSIVLVDTICYLFSTELKSRKWGRIISANFINNRSLCLLSFSHFFARWKLQFFLWFNNNFLLCVCFECTGTKKRVTLAVAAINRKMMRWKWTKHFKRTIHRNVMCLYKFIILLV